MMYLNFKSEKKDSRKAEFLRLGGNYVCRYKFREYLFFFDRTDSVPFRLWSLAMGLQLFRSIGLSDGQFREFHKKRKFFLNLVLGGIVLMFMIIPFALFCLYLLPILSKILFVIYTSALTATISWFNYYTIRFVTKGIRTNILHTEVALSSDIFIHLLGSASLLDNEEFEFLALRLFYKI